MTSLNGMVLRAKMRTPQQRAIARKQAAARARDYAGELRQDAAREQAQAEAARVQARAERAKELSKVMTLGNRLVPRMGGDRKAAPPGLDLLRMPETFFLSGSAQGGCACLLYTLPVMMGRSGSPSRNSTTTSWPMRGIRPATGVLIISIAFPAILVTSPQCCELSPPHSVAFHSRPRRIFFELIYIYIVSHYEITSGGG